MPLSSFTLVVVCTLTTSASKLASLGAVGSVPALRSTKLKPSAEGLSELITRVRPKVLTTALLPLSPVPVARVMLAVVSLAIAVATTVPETAAPWLLVATVKPTPAASKRVGSNAATVTLSRLDKLPPAMRARVVLTVSRAVTEKPRAVPELPAMAMPPAPKSVTSVASTDTLRVPATAGELVPVIAVSTISAMVLLTVSMMEPVPEPPTVAALLPDAAPMATPTAMC